MNYPLAIFVLCAFALFAYFVRKCTKYDPSPILRAYPYVIWVVVILAALSLIMTYYGC